MSVRNKFEFWFYGLPSFKQGCLTWSHKIRTFVHFLCDTVLRTLLQVSPQFQREMSLKEISAKTQVKYVNPGMFLLCRYRYILLCFYYAATGTYCGGSEFKYFGFVPKS